jgi:signal transduction histidine kinase
MHSGINSKHLKNIVNQLPVIIWTTDKDLVIKSIFGAGVHKYNINVKPLIGLKLHDRLSMIMASEQSIKKAELCHKKALKGKDCDYIIITPKLIWKSHVKALKENNGKIIGCLGIAVDVTTSRKNEANLKKSSRGLRALNERIISMFENERINISRDVHDEIGQSLTLLKLDLSRFYKEFLNEKENNNKLGNIKSMLDHIDSTIESVRKISYNLRPGILDDFGLTAAIEWFLVDVSKRGGLNHRFISKIKDEDFEKSLATSLYRIFQEIVTNVLRHANAKSIIVVLRKKRNTIEMIVKDNGIGFNVKAAYSDSTLGLLGIKERVHLHGGKISFESEHGRGTKVCVLVPVRKRR